MVLQSLFYRIRYLVHEERLPLYLVALYIFMSRIPGPEPVCELSAVQFADKNLLESGQHVLRVCRQRIYVVEMNLADILPGFSDLVNGRNGECPMAVIAAHSPAHCFDAAFTAAKLALEHMMPVALLSEGFLGNGSEPWLIPSMKDYPEMYI